MLRVIASRSAQIGQHISNKSCTQILPCVQRRWASYYESEYEGPADKYTNVEKSYEEWKWVVKLIAPLTVPPAPTDPKAEYPSGWKPPNPSIHEDYFIRRTKNHMPPVYTIIKDRGQLRETRIKNVEGNIWALEKEVGKYLKGLHPRRVILTYTHEPHRFVGIKGDFSEDLKEWVFQKGF